MMSTIQGKAHRTQGNRSWFRYLVLDHPVRPDGSHKFGSGDKTKVYCQRCFEHDLAIMHETEEVSVRSHARPEARSDDTLRDLCKSNIPLLINL